MTTKTVVCAVFLLLTAVCQSAPAFGQTDPEQRVYQYIISADESVVDVATALSSQVSSDDMNVLATVAAGVPDGCNYEANVVSFIDPTYAERLMQLNPLTAPFAVIDRINIFEDENGVHVSAINAKSMLRTILLDDPVHQEMAVEHDNRLRELVLRGVGGEEIFEQYGQKRKKGYIGKTMGVMAGGSFDSKIKTIAVLPDRQWEEVANEISANMEMPEREWGLRVVFAAKFPSHETAILGISGERMESKSFSIVKAGSDKKRKKLSCPGLAHAGAYPLELVVRQDGEDVRLETVSSMFRMKMYFEDAGKWAFMKNMGMPGSIAYELKQNAVNKIGTH